MFSKQVGLAAAEWVVALDNFKVPQRLPPDLEAWLASDPSHRDAFRAMRIAACVRRAARPDATVEDLRDLDVVILGKSPTGARKGESRQDDAIFRAPAALSR
jgi:ferric-dicitrate binding protein FerR (iron transport regulator)